MLMQTFSAAGLGFPKLKPVTVPTPPLATIGTSAGVPGHNLENEFKTFAIFAKGRGSLASAVFDHFLAKVIDPATYTLPSGKGVYEAIADQYALMKSTAATGSHPDKLSFFNYALYMYIGIFHFSVWYCEKTSPSKELRPVYKDHIKSEVLTKRFTGDLHLDADFVKTPSFDDIFKLNNSLLQMYSNLNHLVDDDNKNVLGRYKNIISKNGFAAKLDDSKAKQFRLDVMDFVRAECFDIIDRDVKQFVAKIADASVTVGEEIINGYGEIDYLSVGEGSTTHGLFGSIDYALLFMRYSLQNVDHVPGKRKVTGLPLLNASSKNTAATILYFGLEKDDDSETSAPQVQLNGFLDGKAYSDHPTGSTLFAHKKLGHVLARGGNLPAEAILLTDLGPLTDQIKCDFSSAVSAEEMTFLIFKHCLSHPGKEPLPAPPIFLSTDRPHVDNEYQKLLSPASGTTAAVVEPAVFAQPQAELAKLAATLAADTGFEFDVVIEGLGVGEKLSVGSYGKGGRALTKADDQSDRPPGAGYEPLRHDYGWFEWFPGSGGKPGWLTGHVTGFVSPLRCTFEKYFTPAKKTLLDTEFKHRMVKDKQGRPIYNCLLSAFRAFSLFHAMVEQLSKEFDALGTPAAAAAKQKIVDYLKNEASVEVVLPTGMKMSGGPLKHDDIVPFY